VITQYTITTNIINKETVEQTIAESVLIRWGSRCPCAKGQFWGRKGAGLGHARTCPAVDVLKATQQGNVSTVPMPIGGGTRWCCALAQPG